MSNLELWEWVKNTNSDDIMNHTSTINSIYL